MNTYILLPHAHLADVAQLVPYTAEVKAIYEVDS